MVKIKIRKSAPTLRELQRHAKTHTIFRTPHIGNVGNLNLVRRVQGEWRKVPFNIALVDRNMFKIDKDYHPEHVIVGRQAHKLEMPEVFTPFGKMSPVQRQQIASALGIRAKKVPENIATLHYMTAKRALRRQSKVYTVSEWFYKNRGIVRPVLEHLARKGVWAVFERLIDDRGNSYNLVWPPKPRPGVVIQSKPGVLIDPSSTKELVYEMHGGERQIKIPVNKAVELALAANEKLYEMVKTGRVPEPKGNIIGIATSNPVNIIIGAMLQGKRSLLARMTGAKKSLEIYHAAGPNMIRYIGHKDFLSEFERICTALDDFQHKQVPRELGINVFDVTPLRISPLKSRKELVRDVNSLGRVVKAYRELGVQRQNEMRQLAGKPPVEVGRLRKEIGQKFAARFDTIRTEAARVGELLHQHIQGEKKTDVNRTTIYDLVHGSARKQHLIIPREIMDVSLGDLGHVVANIEGKKHPLEGLR